MVKDPLVKMGDMDLILDLGRFHMPQGTYAHAPQLLGPCLEPVFHTREASTMRILCTANKGSPFPPQLDKLCV